MQNVKARQDQLRLRFNDLLGPLQISGKRGPDSRFIIEANTKSRGRKSSRSQIVNLMDRGRVTRPQVEYRVEYQVDYWARIKKNIHNRWCEKK